MTQFKSIGCGTYASLINSSAASIIDQVKKDREVSILDDLTGDRVFRINYGPKGFSFRTEIGPESDSLAPTIKMATNTFDEQLVTSAIHAIKLLYYKIRAYDQLRYPFD